MGLGRRSWLSLGAGVLVLIGLQVRVKIVSRVIGPCGDLVGFKGHEKSDNTSYGTRTYSIDGISLGVLYVLYNGAFQMIVRIGIGRSDESGGGGIRHG